VRADVALCDHLAGADPPLRIEPDEILVFEAGPVEAIGRCARCDATGWLELVDWSPQRDRRVFALAGLRASDVALYFRNVGRGSCDLARSAAEGEALAASAGPFERLVAWDVSARRSLSSAALPAAALPTGAWQERLRASAADATWFAQLGLAKEARL